MDVQTCVACPLSMKLRCAQPPPIPVRAGSTTDSRWVRLTWNRPGYNVDHEVATMKPALRIATICMLLAFGQSPLATSYPAEPAMSGGPPGAGASLAAAFANVIYFPIRFTVTVLTAGIGGFTGWMTGGYEPAADAVWESTDG